MPPTSQSQLLTLRRKLATTTAWKGEEIRSGPHRSPGAAVGLLDRMSFRRGARSARYRSWKASGAKCSAGSSTWCSIALLQIHHAGDSRTLHFLHMTGSASNKIGTVMSVQTCPHAPTMLLPHALGISTYPQTCHLQHCMHATSMSITVHLSHWPRVGWVKQQFRMFMYFAQASIHQNNDIKAGKRAGRRESAVHA